MIATSPSRPLRDKIHGTFFALLIVIGVFGVWLYIILDKTMNDIQSIAWQIQSNRIVAQYKKNKNTQTLPSSEALETSAN